MKKIFDVNKLDLVKVGKAFGFSVPPRVNVTVGGGSGGGGRTGAKRKRGDGDEDDGEVDVDGESGDRGRGVSRSQTKGRRKEQLGGKKIDKEVYRNKRPKGEETAQWSR